mmetsp:Transcript_17769/g.30087  ORF Transcript_17769/g.30087 Transcript_17769/m.30087 type:complete len:115 (+) Transcript_17769:1179-1523(+)
MDTIGRFMGGSLNEKISAKAAITMGILRLVFIPTTILIAFKSNPEWLFDGDWFKIVNMIIFALSNGFISTLCAIKAPSFAKEDQREQIGIFISLFIGLGIVSGSIITLFVGKMF